MNQTKVAEWNPAAPAAGARTGVAVVIPAFNEGPHVADQVQRVQAVLATTDWDFEIIVVDDGSTDNTASAAAATGVRVIRNVRNMGYGAALKRGIAETGFDWILITDADGTYPADVIPRMLDQVADPDLAVDMVTGARVGKEVHIQTARRPAKWFLNRLASYLAGQDLPDLNSGLRLMRRTVVERYVHLLPSGFSFTTTITLACACNGHPVVFMPIDYHARLGSSKIRPRHAFDFALLIIRTIVFFNPLKVFVPIGFALAVAGLMKFIYDVFIGNLSESAIFALLAALIIWCVGLLADQNARIASSR
ncbi:MAG TPA: glycosyltransferase family 2 protein [Longimicrobiales bacterium]